jgi:hypothetical protein
MSALSLWSSQPELSFIDRFRACWHRIYPGHPGAEDVMIPSGLLMKPATSVARRSFSRCHPAVGVPHSYRVPVIPEGIFPTPVSRLRNPFHPG